jgi:hypothetical protein
MKKSIVFFGLIVLLFVLLTITSVPMQAAIAASERAALIALYNATNGDSWTSNNGWKQPPLSPDGFAAPGTENDWYGISVSGNHVTAISLSNNRLNGSIPAELGNLSYMTILYLNKNQLLSGSIPPELGNLSNLRTLALEQGQLSGSIPKELGKLNHLEWLFLYENQLSGSIPKQLGNLSNLTYFDLNGNRLTGSIPPELGNLSKLVQFLLNGNQLSGDIPTSLTNLTNLSSGGMSIDYNGLYTNDDTLRTFLNSKNPGWEDTQTTAPSGLSAAAVSNSSIKVSWTPIKYTGDSGGYKIYRSTTSGGPWTYLGMTADKNVSSYDIIGLSAGTTYYVVIKTQTNPHYYNENTVVSEYSEEASAETGLLEEKDPPFGSFDTPIDGSTVASSIPVTGWALDDSGIASVEIYREQGNNLVYIGDAYLVEGARPDVAEAFPGYPNNTRAGWGYMMLTNFLPNNGNGTFVIHAMATDFVGKTTTLGTKTITCDNANAVKPFGAIDTPLQGGTASGSGFINWGWVLTPQPNHIPTDGSTINVYVDGVNLGHPIYNIYRSDIANFFPGYANSDGAAGYFSLDTTAYENGVHTIQWTATDNAGNTDGIGSRYFTIQNTGGNSRMAALSEKCPGLRVELSRIPVDFSELPGIKRSYQRDSKLENIYTDEKGFINIETRELERIEIHLGTLQADSSRYSGYLVVGGKLKPLPIGATLNAAGGVFYWQPGPGFIGEYEFVFIKKVQGGGFKKKNIRIVINPK